MGKLESGCSLGRMKEGYSGAENSANGMFADEGQAGWHMDGFTCQSWVSTNQRPLFALLCHCCFVSRFTGGLVPSLPTQRNLLAAP